MNEEQYRALFVISSAIAMLALVLIPSILVYIYG